MEIVNIRQSDISFKEQHVSIFVPKSKTDKYNEGFYVCIAKNWFQNLSCKYSERILEMVGIEGSSDEFIFRQITYMKKVASFKLRNTNQPLLILEQEKLNYSFCPRCYWFR